MRILLVLTRFESLALGLKLGLEFGFLFGLALFLGGLLGSFLFSLFGSFLCRLLGVNLGITLLGFGRITCSSTCLDHSAVADGV